ncbi:unnamed protein product, partial [marine sediment metagenome]
MVVDDDENGIGIVEADMMKTYALKILKSIENNQAI